MGLNEDVLRFMTIAIEEVDENPSVIMQSKSDRPERGERGERSDRGDRGAPRERAPKQEEAEQTEA